MSTRRSKRNNQEAADEPAAKRTATQQNGIANFANSNRDNSMLRAQAAMDRLDFNTGVKLCTEILASNPLNPTQPLLLRSIGLERLGQVYEAAKDVARALRTKETRETHLRATFNFLGLALHHLEIAQQLPSQEEALMTSTLSNSDLLEMEDDIVNVTDREPRSPFDRFSPELFNKVMSFSDSPSIAIGTSVCKSWNKSILEAIGLFRHFEMEGKVSNIMKGIKTFGGKSNSPLQSITLKIKEEVTDSEKEQLHELILPSCGSLRSLSVAHHGELCKFIVGIASLCPALTVLSSTESLDDGIVTFTAPKFETVSFLPSWKPKLRKLIWNGGRESLLCDDALVDRLQEATDVTICSRGAKSSFVVKLLSSNSSLVELELPWTKRDKVQGMGSTSFNLPHLERLRLHRTPLATEDVNCSLFFKNFNAPRLRELYVERLNPKDLSLLKSESSPQILTVESLLVEPTQETVTTLIQAMKDWESLKEIHLLLPSSTPSVFWDFLIRTITILSREAVESGYKNHVLFPQLNTVTLGADSEVAEESHGSLISASALASMVSSRLAVHRGLSHKEVFLSASGDFDSSLLPPSGQDIAFVSVQTSLVEHLEINTPLTSGEAVSWLQDNVDEFRNNCNSTE